jgi:AAA+ superfamily predicted ATPase
MQYFRNEWEYLEARFKVIEILKDWDQKKEKKEIKKKGRQRNFAKEIKTAKSSLNLRHKNSVERGMCFNFDQICNSAGLCPDEQLIMTFLLYSRFNTPGGKTTAQEMLKIIFPRAKKRLTCFRFLSPEERLIRKGLVDRAGTDFMVSERVCKKYMKVKKNNESSDSPTLQPKSKTSYDDYLKASYRLADLMWERSRTADSTHVHSENKIVQDDLDELSCRIMKARSHLESLAASDEAGQYPLVQLVKKYGLCFDEQMIVVAFMQNTLNLMRVEDKALRQGNESFKVMEIAGFLAPTQKDMPHYFKYFQDNAKLIGDGILESERWCWVEAIQTKEFWLAGEVLEYLADSQESDCAKRLQLLGAKLQEKAVKSGKVTQPRFTLEDVILEDSKKLRLMSALTQCKSNDLIFKEWGFEEKIKYGTGVTMLFAGPPGTGKTLAAEAVAGHLGKKVMLVDYSKLISCWVGDTEKNIAKAFRSAHEKDAVLVFDEADTVLADRSNATRSWEVREVNVLLCEIEKSKGVVIFTTNRHDNLDPAVERRIALRLKFDPPGASERLLLWKRHLPDKAPLDQGIDFNRLASDYSLTGAQIKNIVLNAARRAVYRASTGQDARIMDQDIQSAVRDEKTLCWSSRSSGPIGFVRDN